MSGMSFCLTEGPFALPEDAMRSTAATFPRIVAVEGLSEETIFVLPGPRQVSRITDARTGKTYEVGESLEGLRPPMHGDQECDLSGAVPRFIPVISPCR